MWMRSSQYWLRVEISDGRFQISEVAPPAGSWSLVSFMLGARGFEFFLENKDLANLNMFKTVLEE